MKLATFFEKFDQLAEAPGAVAKMRELVLDLAVQGKIVAQDSSDESASLLIEELQSRSKLQDRPICSPLDSTDEPFQLPECWKWIRLRELLPEFQNGASSRGDEHGVPSVVLRLADIIRQRISLKATRAIPINAKDIDKYALRRGDTLITRVNGSADIVGSFVPVETDLKAIYCDHFIRLRIDQSAIVPAFLAVLGKTPLVRQQIQRLFLTTAGQKTVNQGHIGSLIIPLPPLAEQKRIVAKVDELMALCDRLEAQQQERETRHTALARASLARFADVPTPANLNFLFHKSYTIDPADLRKSILTLAVQGKLVPQEPENEPGTVLLERIQVELSQQTTRRACKSSTLTALSDKTEVSVPLPLGWEWVRLRSIVFTLGDGLHGTPEYSNGTDCYFINGNNLVNGRIVIKPNTKTVSRAEMHKHSNPMTLNTILVSINGTLGSVAFYNNEKVVLGKSACYFTLSSLVDKHFVRLVLESPYFAEYAKTNATGTTIRNLGLKAMNSFPVPLPPLAEQRRIVAKVDQLMALVDQLETQLAASRATAQNLLDAIVAELAAAGSPPTKKPSRRLSAAAV